MNLDLVESIVCWLDFEMWPSLSNKQLILEGLGRFYDMSFNSYDILKHYEVKKRKDIYMDESFTLKSIKCIYEIDEFHSYFFICK